MGGPSKFLLFGAPTQQMFSGPPSFLIESAGWAAEMEKCQ